MTAAVITATAVQKIDMPSSVISGSAELRLMKLVLQGPKAAQNDWFLLSSYLTTAETSNILSVYALIDAQTASANLCALDTFTYTGADAKVVLSGSTTGVAFVEVTYFTE